RGVSLDYLVGALLKNPRHVEAERLGGLEVENQIELSGLLDRQTSRLLTSQDAINVRCASQEHLDRIDAIRHQATARHVITKWIDRGQSVLRSQPDDHLSIDLPQRAWKHDQPTIRLSRHRRDSSLHLGGVANVRCD